MPYIIDSLVPTWAFLKLPSSYLYTQQSGFNGKSQESNKNRHLTQTFRASETESYIHLEITRQSKTGLEIIKNKIDQILFEINVSNVDRHLIKLRMMDIVNDIHPLPKASTSTKYLRFKIL